MAEKTKTHEDRLKKTFEPIKRLMKEKGWDWNLKIEINAYPDISYILTYAPIRWSNGTRQHTHISEHTTHGLDYDKQPMTKINFKSGIDLYHWVYDLPFSMMETQIMMVFNKLTPTDAVRACYLCKGHWMAKSYHQFSSVEVEELQCDYEKCPNYEFKTSEENDPNQK